jgi:hypothetical protein
VFLIKKIKIIVFFLIIIINLFFIIYRINLSYSNNDFPYNYGNVNYDLSKTKSVFTSDEINYYNSGIPSLNELILSYSTRIERGNYYFNVWGIYITFIKFLLGNKYWFLIYFLTGFLFLLLNIFIIEKITDKINIKKDTIYYLMVLLVFISPPILQLHTSFLRDSFVLFLFLTNIYSVLTKKPFLWIITFIFQMFIRVYFLPIYLFNIYFFSDVLQKKNKKFKLYFINFSSIFSFIIIFNFFDKFNYNISFSFFINYIIRFIEYFFGITKVLLTGALDFYDYSYFIMLENFSAMFYPFFYFIIYINILKKLKKLKYDFIKNKIFIYFLLVGFFISFLHYITFDFLVSRIKIYNIITVFFVFIFFRNNNKIIIKNHK